MYTYIYYVDYKRQTIKSVCTDLLRRTRKNKNRSLLIIIFSYFLSVHQSFVLKCRHSTWTGRSQDRSARFQIVPNQCNGGLSRKCPIHWLDDQVNPKMCYSRELIHFPSIKVFTIYTLLPTPLIINYEIIE